MPGVMTGSAEDHESALIEAFVVKPRRERLLTSLRDRRRRAKAVDRLNHFQDLDPRFLVHIAPRDQTPTGIAALLEERGAPATCHVVSSAADLDGEEMPLLAALEGVVGFGAGTLLSCVPGRLAYFEGEEANDRYILQRESA